MILLKNFPIFFAKYQKDLEEKMRRRKFVFDSVALLYYKLNKIRLIRGESYIDSPGWLKNKKATINAKYNDNKSCHHTLTVVLGYQNIKINPRRISQKLSLLLISKIGKR